MSDVSAMDESVANLTLASSSPLLTQYGMQCTQDRKYREMEMARCLIRGDRYLPESTGGIVLCIRRWHNPKPYISSLRRNERCVNFMCQPEYQPWNDGGGQTGRTMNDLEENWIYVVTDNGSIEHTQGSHLAGGNPMAECLMKYNNFRGNCTKEIAAHEAGMHAKVTAMAIASQLDSIRALLFAGLRMPATYFLFALLWGLVLRRKYGLAWMTQNRWPIVLGWAALWAVLLWVIQVIDAKFDK